MVCSGNACTASPLNFALQKLMNASRVQLAKLAGVSEAGHDHFYKVLRATAQWELIDETPEGKLFSPNASTKELVRGKEASLGHFVDHQVRQ